MAYIDATRERTFAQKKVRSVLNVKVDDLLFTNNDIALASANFLVANLPANALIVSAIVNVKEASDAATTATVQLGTAEAGAQILAATDLKTVAVTADGLVAELDTGSGQPIYMRVIISGALTTVGAAEVTIEYIEYDKNNGEYTQFS